MSGGWQPAVPLIAAAPLLLFMAYEDLRHLRISNRNVFLLAGVFAVCLLFLDWPEAGYRLAAAASVFALGLVLFAARLIAGGDVKMLAAVMLFVPAGSLQGFALSFSIGLGLSVVVLSAARAAGPAAFSGWAGVAGSGLPMAPSICAGALFAPLAQQLLTPGTGLTP